MKYPLFLFSLLVCFLSSCVQRPDEKIAKAESLMNEYPDSALRVLQSIPDPHELTGKQQADYCLLLSQAMDKNDLPLNDSLLNVALGYYKDSSDAGRKAKTYFYQGRYHYELQEYEEAAEAFKEAEKWAVRDNNDELASLIYNHLGCINNMQFHCEKALSYFKQALCLSEKLNKTERAVYNLLEIAKTFYYMQKKDSVLFYNSQLSVSTEQCSDKTKGYIYHFLGASYLDYNELTKALEYLQRSLQYTNEETAPYTYAVLGNVYAKRNELEQANCHWQKALSTDKPSTKAFIYESMFSTLLKEKRYQDAALCADSVITIIQDLYADKLDGELLRIQEQYDNESLRMEILEHSIKRYKLTSLFTGILLGVVCLFFLYRRYKNEREAEIKDKITRKELELVKYKFEMSKLEEKMNQSEEEKERLLLEHCELEQKIETNIAELETYKNSLKNRNTAKEEITKDDLSVFRGMKICSRLLNMKDVSVCDSDYQDIINYYSMMDFRFAEWFNETIYSLTDSEKVICIFLRMNIPHRVIASSLNIKIDSLTRKKTRIKKDKIKLKDEVQFDDFVKKIQ